ncbi:hypothetical protein C7E17_27320, partial [Stenotrophomonas maltophilia]
MSACWPSCWIGIGYGFGAIRWVQRWPAIIAACYIALSACWPSCWIGIGYGFGAIRWVQRWPAIIAAC